MGSIAAALLTETETPLTSTEAALDNSRPVQLIAAVVRILPEEQAIDPLAEELATSDPAIVPVVASALQEVQVAWGPAIVRVAVLDAVRARARAR